METGSPTMIASIVSLLAVDTFTPIASAHEETGLVLLQFPF